jgi:hypothetical protein
MCVLGVRCDDVVTVCTSDENVTAPGATDAIDVIAIESREATIDTLYPNPIVCPQQVRD